MYVLDRVVTDDSKSRQEVDNVFIDIYSSSSIKDSKIPSIFSISPPRPTLAKATLLTDLKLNVITSNKQPTFEQETTSLYRTSRSRFQNRAHPSKLYYRQQQHHHETIKSKPVQAILTATALVWCFSDLVHTDSIAWNRYMHSINGNRPGKVKDFGDIMYQNLPGTLGVDTLGTQLSSIVERIKPDVLFVGEAHSENVKAACPDGYNWVGVGD